MRKTIAKAMLLMCVCVLVLKPSDAQTTKTSVAGVHESSHLKLVVILSRHGVRSSTWTQERLDSYSAALWPKWSVPPGDLTSRGYQLIKQFASYDRTSLAQAGLVAAHGCEDASKTYIWADTDERTMESGKAFAEAFFPGCPPPVHSLAAGERDPLYHSAANGVKQATTDTIPAQQAKDAQPQIGPVQRELIQEMQHVLLGCAPKLSCTPTRMPLLSLTAAPASSLHGTNGNAVESQDPLALASSFAEDLLLEYADGMPMDQVGWGNVDEVQLRKFLDLHTENFQRTHRTPVQARLESSQMLWQITRTLQQAVEHKHVPGAIGPADSKLVLLDGHDTNIAGVAALLGVHWTLDGRRDDTPPGTELAFQLWQDQRGAYAVRVTVAMQTLRQMRQMQILTEAFPPAHATLALQGCNVGQTACSWIGFRRIAGQGIDNKDVFQARPK